LFGITAGDWICLLEDNDYAMYIPYWHRAWFITLHSWDNSIQRRREEERYGPEVTRKAAFEWFAKKLTWKYRRPLLLKSPPHTGRIRLLLELFPEARFVHIHRDPYVVFQSSRHTYRTVSPIFALQRPDWRDLDDRVLHYYRLLYEAFFKERRLIPAGRFHEVGLEALEKDPLGELKRMYEQLALTGFETLRPRYEGYLASLAGYRKNKFCNLRPSLRSRIAQEWERNFDEWGYRSRG
jgi:hypothetical protein